MSSRARCWGAWTAIKSRCSNRMESPLKILWWRVEFTNWRGNDGWGATSRCGWERVETAKTIGRKAKGDPGSGANSTKVLGQCFVQSQTGAWRKRRGLGIAEDFDRLFRRVHHDAAVFAFLEMHFDRVAQDGVERFVQIIRQFADDLFALHGVFSRRKC